MNLSDIFLGCFVFGLLWSLVSVLLGGFHSHGHGGHMHHGPHIHGPTGHAPAGHTGHAHPGHTQAGAPPEGVGHGWMEHFLSVHTVAIFLAWMGGCGYLMLWHTHAGIWIVLAIAAFTGLAGAAALAAFLRFLHGREFAMDSADYQMVGVLGRISSPIRKDGTGEMLFTRDGARKLAYVRSETGEPVGRNQEVVVTSYKGGIAYVRTWENLAGEDIQSLYAPKESSSGDEDAPLAAR